jgi:predicted glycosyltransferase involved in capsule biosynthesis
MAGVKNLGAQKCTTPYILFTDMDTLVSETLIKQILNLSLENEAKVLYKFNRTILNRTHPGVILIKTSDFWSIGGFDEDFSGNYGFDDILFLEHAKRQKYQIKKMKDFFLDHITEGGSNISRDIAHNRNLYRKKNKSCIKPENHIRFEYMKIH